MKLSIFSAAVLAFAAPLAHAHSELTSSMPADKSSVAAAPKELMLHFSEPVRLTAVAVAKSGEAKHDLALPSERMKDFTIAAPGLGDGQYTVSWRALSEDSHVANGSFSFSVGSVAATSHDHHAGAASSEHTEHSEHHDEAGHTHEEEQHKH